MKMKKRKKVEFEKSSGNVFADLGLEDAGELFARSQIGVFVFKILKDKKLKQREIANVLAIAQPEVSHLMNGHFSRFTTDKLLDFLKRFEQKVTIQVSRHHKGEPYQQVTSRRKDTERRESVQLLWQRKHGSSLRGRDRLDILVRLGVAQAGKLAWNNAELHNSKQERLSPRLDKACLDIPPRGETRALAGPAGIYSPTWANAWFISWSDRYIPCWRSSSTMGRAAGTSPCALAKTTTASVP
jgi:predicted XRE-type DNA-binding protein